MPRIPRSLPSRARSIASMDRGTASGSQCAWMSITPASGWPNAQAASAKTAAHVFIVILGRAEARRYRDLKHQAERVLHLASAVGDSLGGGASEKRTPDGRAWVCPHQRIRQVVGLQPEFHFVALLDRKCLGKRAIQIPENRSGNAGILIRIGPRSKGRQHAESISVEPFRRARIFGMGIAHNFRPAEPDELTRAVGVNAAHLPAADRAVQNWVHSRSELAALAERKIVGAGDRQTVPRVIRSQPEYLVHVLLDIVEVRFISLLVIVVGEQDACAGSIRALRTELKSLIARPPVAPVVGSQRPVLRIGSKQATPGHGGSIALRAGENVRRQKVIKGIRNILRKLRLQRVAEVRIGQVEFLAVRRGPPDVHKPCGVHFELAGNFTHDREIHAIVDLRPVILIRPTSWIAEVRVHAETLANRQLQRIRTSRERIAQVSLRPPFDEWQRRGSLIETRAPPTGRQSVGAGAALTGHDRHHISREADVTSSLVVDAEGGSQPRQQNTFGSLKRLTVGAVRENPSPVPFGRRKRKEIGGNDWRIFRNSFVGPGEVQVSRIDILIII